MADQDTETEEQTDDGDLPSEDQSSAYGELKEGGVTERGAITVEEVVEVEGALGEDRKRMVLNMGPQHPSTHGVLRLVTTLEGETVIDVEPDIGYLHRNWEKIVEGWTWPQVIALSDRNDYLSPINNEVAYCLAVEKLLDIEVPERATYLRMILNEISRIASHLISVGTYGLDLGAITAFLYAFREREKAYDIFERVSGARMLPNYLRLGGVRNDVPDEFEDMVTEFCDIIENVGWPEYENLLIQNEIFKRRTQDVGVLPREDAIAWGASGPVLRGSGVEWDLRKVEPYLYYDRVDFDVVTAEGCDCFARTRIKMDEMLESVKIIRQALDQMPEGKVQAKMPRAIRPDEGDVFVRTESARGEIGVYLVSDGGSQPYRAKWRAPSFVNLATMPIVGRGHLIADLVACIGSLDPVFGEVDR